MAHAVFVSKRPGFLPVGTPTRIWKELMDNRFTTPMLRGWMPYIVEQLRAKDLLRDAWCYRCQSVLLTATTEDLDQIVTEGVASVLWSSTRRPPRRPKTRFTVSSSKLTARRGPMIFRSSGRAGSSLRLAIQAGLWKQREGARRCQVWIPSKNLRY